MLVRIQALMIFALLLAVVVIGFESFGARRESARNMDKLGRGIEGLSRRLDLLAAKPSGDSKTPSSTEHPIRTVGFNRESGRAGDIPAKVDQEELETATWMKRFKEKPLDWRHALTLLQRIAKLPPDVGIRLMTEMWPDLSSAQKLHALGPFVSAGHPHILKLIHLSATDENQDVQGKAFEFLKGMAFQDFNEDQAGYRQWAETFKDKPVKQALAESARAFMDRLGDLDPDALGKQLEAFNLLHIYEGRLKAFGADLAGAFDGTQASQLLERALLQGEIDAQKGALRWAAYVRPDQEWMNRNVRPLLEQNELDQEVLGRACTSLGRSDLPWAREALAGVMERRALGVPEGKADGPTWSAAMALAKIKDSRAIPHMIALIVADSSYNTVYGIGHFGLRELTGVPHDGSHDGNWWLNWWKTNQARLPPEVRGMPIPNLGQ